MAGLGNYTSLPQPSRSIRSQVARPRDERTALRVFPAPSWLESEFAEEVVFRHEFDVLALVLKLEGLGRLAGHFLTRGQGRWVKVPDYQDVSSLGDGLFWNAADFNAHVPGILPGHGGEGAGEDDDPPYR